MRDNLGTIIARRAANGAATVLVLAGAGVALAVLAALGHGSRRPAGGSALVGLVLVVAVVAAGLVGENVLVGHVWPSLMPSVRP